MSRPDAKQMTVWIDRDVYQAMVLEKAKGGGSLKEQINRALRQTLEVEDTATLEAKERAAYAEKPWDEQDDEDVALWRSSQVWAE